jgi:hypothetical protein
MVTQQGKEVAMIKVELARNDDGALRARDWHHASRRADLRALCKPTARHRKPGRTPYGRQPGSVLPRAI